MWNLIDMTLHEDMCDKSKVLILELEFRPLPYKSICSGMYNKEASSSSSFCHAVMSCKQGSVL